MPKGVPWTREEEKQLKQMLEANKSVRVIAKALGKTRDCVRMKIMRLGLEVVVHPEISTRTTTSPLSLPEELGATTTAQPFKAPAKILSASSTLGKSERTTLGRSKINRQG